MHAAQLQSLGRWNLALARALAACHGEDFPARLLDAIDTQVPVEGAQISLERRGSAPVLIYERGTPAGTRDQLTRRYFESGYLLDPFCLAVEQGLAEGFYSLAEIAPDDFFNSEFYKSYYVAAGIVEDCYYIVDVDEDCKVSISLYNSFSRTRLRPVQIRHLRTLEPMVLALAHRHWDATTQPLPDVEVVARGQGSIRDFGSELLTEREQAICQLLLSGHSAKSSARTLGISPETVRMHRKNLYGKLGVASQAELFALFIQSLGGR